MLSRKPWHEVATQLVDVAMGRQPADLVIRGGRWVNVHTREIIPNTDVAVAAGGGMAGLFRTCTGIRCGHNPAGHRPTVVARRHPVSNSRDRLGIRGAVKRGVRGNGP